MLRYLLLAATSTITLLQLEGAALASSNNDVCGLYLAPTSLSISNTDEYGIYAGRNYTFGEHVGPKGTLLHISRLSNILGGDDSYVIDPLQVGGVLEGHDVGSWIFNAMLVKFHASLNNVELGEGRAEPLLDRYEDPGAGASTTYHNFDLFAKKDIAAGSELFLEAQDWWFNQNKLPLRKDYEFIDNIVAGLRDLYLKHDVSDLAFRDILYRMKRELITIETPDRNYVADLLPDSWDDLVEAYQLGSAQRNLKRHDELWLRKNGKCLDNIVEGESSVENAGRGAFASRLISEGDLVVPMPLVHVSEEKLLDNEGVWEVLLNYCFGHSDSDILFCPTTLAGLINHSENPNARIEWSKSETGIKDWRTASYEELMEEKKSKLMFDVIALRDIQPGEEVFINYGEEWSDAWDEYIESWSPPTEDYDVEYVSAFSLNELNAELPVEEDEYYPHHLFLCRVEPYAHIDPPEAPIPEQDYNANPSIDPKTWDKFTKASFENNFHTWWWPCDIKGVNEAGLYSTLIYEKINPKFDGDDLIEHGRPVRVVHNTPRESIKFTDRPYHSDQHLVGAFRYFISIPDYMFPLHWRSSYMNSSEILQRWDKRSDFIPNEATKQRQDEIKRNATCGLYYAESTIPGAGNGVYLGVDLPAGMPVTDSVPPIVIPDMDLGDRRWDAHDYTWEGGGYGAEYETRRNAVDDAQVLAVDMGMMCNFHPGLVNSHMGPTKFYPYLDRNKDPGAGASSDYMDHSFISDISLFAGDEVFISYGESWFMNRSYLNHVPLSANYQAADQAVASILGLLTGTNGNTSNEAILALMETVKNSVIGESKTQNVLKTIETVDDIFNINSKNGTAQVTTERRSLEWLEENGQCIDNIYVNRSTIEQAGNGAFARRFIKEGDVIIPAPFIATYGRDTLETLPKLVEDGANEYQLILNYHLSHPNSTAMFFPANRAIAVNHKSSRKSQEGPNAKLRWSTRDKRSKYYEQRHIDDLKENHYTVMIMEFVATRDIQPDEEVFIDYGEEWESAWEAHVKEFQERTSTISRVLNAFSSSECGSRCVYDMNQNKFEKNFHQWTSEHITVCKTGDLDESYSDEWVEVKEGRDYHGIEYSDKGFDLMRSTPHVPIWTPCRIISSTPNLHFDVAIHGVDADNESLRFLRRVRTLPPDLLEYRSFPGKSDQWSNKAFRHEIKIPDDVFPKIWMDLD